MSAPMPIAPKSSDANNAPGDGKLMRQRAPDMAAERRRRQRRRLRKCDSGSVRSARAAVGSATLELAANLAARIFRAVNVDVELACLVSRKLLLGQLGVRGGGERVAALGERNDDRAIA